MSKSKPQVGDIWKWNWESGYEAYVLLTEWAEKQIFMGIDLTDGNSQLWEFGETYAEGWTFIA